MSQKKLNVLLITADQWRGDTLGVAGHQMIKTPNLDALAGEAVYFRRHFTQAVPCGPSRTSLLTGMYAMNHRSIRNGTPLDATFTNLAKEARTKGYDPNLIGYTDTSMDVRLFDPNDPRVHRYWEILPGMTQFSPGSEGGMDDEAWNTYLSDLGYDISKGQYRQKENYPDSERRGPAYAPTHFKAEHSDTKFTTDTAMRFMRQKGDEGWFLHLSYLKPHPPFVAPEPYNAMYDPEDVPAFRCLSSLEEEKSFHPHLAYKIKTEETLRKFGVNTNPNDSLWWKQVRATYYGMMSEVDHHLGRLISFMKEAGMYENTLIVFTSDHGEQLGDHWMWEKELPFDSSAHIPLIVRMPGEDFDSARGQHIESFSENIDIMPTILEAIGHHKPLQCDGHSLLPFLQGATPKNWRKEVHWEIDFRDVLYAIPEEDFGLKLDQCGITVIRDHRYKYVHYSNLPPMFFDLQEDPGELHNVAGNADYHALMLEYAQKMLSWRMDHNRRELTGYLIKPQGVISADRSRRYP